MEENITLNLDELIQQEFAQPNYLIQTNKPTTNETYTVIYFSSCGLYESSNPDNFIKEIINKNRFEYYGTRIKKASKHIFLRDISKQHYLNGINNEINSSDKLLEFLKRETEGSKIITIGASSGGFAAVLFGILLNAEYIFSFSGQYSLIPIYNKIHKYADLSEIIQSSNIPIFYMFPAQYDDDIEQFDLIKHFNNIYVLPIKSSIHGVPVIKDTLRSLINSDLKTLKKLYNYKDKNISESALLLKHFGICKVISKIIKKNIACISKKYAQKR